MLHPVRFLFFASALVPLCLGASDRPRAPADALESGVPRPQVQAVAQTQPVPSMDDAADDPALWVHPTDPALSRIIGTDKKHGLFSYSLSGKQLQALPVGRLNNVDVRQSIGGLDIAAATNRTTKSIDLFLIDSAGVISPAGSVPSGFADPYGICLYHSRKSGELFVFGCDKGGLVRQWRVDLSNPKQLTGTAVRSFEIGGQAEGMVCDEQAGSLFVGEERAGIWRYDAEPAAGVNEPEQHARTLIAAAMPLGPLVADVEGLAIARSPGQPGHLVVSSQGDNSFHLFGLAPPHAHRGLFTVTSTRGSTSADAGAVQETDGIEVYAMPLGPAFPEGIMIVQDGENAPEPQNFKIINWADVRRTLGLASPAGPAATTPAASPPAAREPASTEARP